MLACLATVLTPGCTCGNFGTLIGKRTTTATAAVFDIYSFGLQMRWMRSDAGGTIGYRHSTYVYPVSDLGSSRGSAAEYSLFRVPLPRQDPLSCVTTSLGAEFQWLPGLRRVSLGYLDQAITQAPENPSVVKLYYNRANPRLTEAVVRPCSLPE